MWPFSLPNPLPFLFYPTCCFARLSNISLQQYQTLALKRTLAVQVSPLDGCPTAKRNTILQNTIVHPELLKLVLVILVVRLATAYRSHC